MFDVLEFNEGFLMLTKEMYIRLIKKFMISFKTCNWYVWNTHLVSNKPLLKTKTFLIKT